MPNAALSSHTNEAATNAATDPLAFLDAQRAECAGRAAATIESLVGEVDWSKLPYETTRRVLIELNAAGALPSIDDERAYQADYEAKHELFELMHQKDTVLSEDFVAELVKPIDNAEEHNNPGDVVKLLALARRAMSAVVEANASSDDDLYATGVFASLIEQLTFERMSPKALGAFLVAGIVATGSNAVEFFEEDLVKVERQLAAAKMKPEQSTTEAA